MACFYVGFCYKQRKNGVLKIGQTSKNTPAARAANIRTKEHFQILGYLTIDADKPNMLFVESFVRKELARKPDLEHFGNDHFAYRITEGMKYEQAESLAAEALGLAKMTCEAEGLPYSEGIKTYKRG